MTASYLPITAQIGDHTYPRHDVLAWETKRAARVARRLGIKRRGSSTDLNRRILDRKLELGPDAIEQMLQREFPISSAVGRLGAAASLGRRNVATTILRCDTGACQMIPDFYRTASRSDEGRPTMLAASPDHWIFRRLPDGRDQVVETAAGSPWMVQIFLDENDLSTVRTPRDPAFAVHWAAVARTAGGTPIGGVQHRFRDEPAGGFTVELNAEFPITLPRPMVDWHRWHLAGEFSNWLEYANGVRAAR